MARFKSKKEKQKFFDMIALLMDAHEVSVPESKKQAFLDSLMGQYEVYKPDKPAEKPVEHWQHCVDLYFVFYKSINNGIEPAFPPSEAAALKYILNLLNSRFINKNPNSEWTLEICLHRLNEFFKTCCQLAWVRSHFSIGYLRNNHDKIISELVTAVRREEEVEKKLLGR